LLEVRELTVGYRGALTALTDVSLTVPDDRVVAVLGSNGAGKSTLLRAISGVLDRHNGHVVSGSIRFDGNELVGRSSSEIVRAGVVQVPEGRRIFADLTVDENLRIGGHTGSARRRERQMDRIRELFPILADRRHGRAGLLSGGEQQMLAIGRALMADPKILLLDEPSLGLAPLLVEQIGDIITTINATGTSVLLIEQNASMGLEVAHDAIVLEVGRVTADGPAAELAATDEVRDRYLGMGAAAGSTVAAGVEADADDTGSGATTPTDAADRASVRRSPRPVVAEGITMRFGGVTALAGVDIDLEPGRIHALIGPNGAGKSTCINVLSGVIRPTEGTVRLGDVDLTRTRGAGFAELGIARTFQNLSLSPEATVLESILVGRHHLMRAGLFENAFRLPRSRRDDRVHRAVAERVAAEVGVHDRLHTRVRELPYGDRKRVELARAICGDPDILMLDEPVAGMTHGESQDMATAIRTAHALHGFTVLLVEHDMSFVMGLADRITVLDFGQRIAQGTPAEIQHDPTVQAAYLGHPAA